MTDVKFDLCGNTFKIARSWFVIDWCTSESITKNQIIMVKDSKGPQFECNDTLIIKSNAYICAVGLTEILPPPFIVDCNAYTFSISLFAKNGNALPQYISNVLGKNYIENVPVGEYILTYILLDACGNRSLCDTKLIIYDDTAPYAVCDQTTKTSLDANGKARVFAFSFDDGSTDNCGIAGYQVRRMLDKCGFGTKFGPFVDFCCEDIGTVQMVALEVTDIHGNKNTCMVEVIVEDKLKPTLTCPPDLTLACTDVYDENHLDDFGRVVTKLSDVKDVIINNYYHSGKIGKDGLASDNCMVTVTTSYIKNINCHVGNIKRKFIATDGSGLKDSCIQTITILNPDYFDENDITWPDHYVGDGCKSSQTNPEITGKPKFKNTTCSTVAATFEDNAFYIADGACLKIIRTWTVVDWCQFTGSNNTGKWGPYIQTIKLHNTDKPYFTSICKDTLVCSYDANCSLGLVDIQQEAMDACTDKDKLIWKYELDLNNNGSIDSTSASSRFQKNLTYGTHKIFWRVEDQCGNFSACSQLVTIKDCKKPTPYCITSLTLGLNQNSGNIAIWAKDFNLGSFDNCTDTSDLIFTFDGAIPKDSLILQQHYFKGNGDIATIAEYNSGLAQIWLPEKRSSGLVFDCTDIPNGISNNIILKMTVTDEAGNQDFCLVELVIQDNVGVCPDVITQGKISGTIKTTNQKTPKSTLVQYTSSLENKQGQAIIDSITGIYVLDTLVLGQDYDLRPNLNSSVLEGVTTLDLVMIQRHILGLAPFSSPYKLIASDVNSSKSVTASDLTELRKLILGITDKFPKDLNSWVFVPSDYIFVDQSVPYNFDRFKKIEQLGPLSDQNDFIAIKIGDVNESALFHVAPEGGTQNRNNNVFEVKLSKEIIDGKPVMALRSGQAQNVDGFQLCLEYEDSDAYFIDGSNSDENDLTIMTVIMGRIFSDVWLIIKRPKESKKINYWQKFRSVMTW
ncbi:MAG: hypothetical protein IPO92_00440 [Saprospiraceae bacterium]|nr:hypothetical protein [Saprospiraceae bacterium]